MKVIKSNSVRQNFTTINFKDKFVEKESQYNTLLGNIVTAFNTIEYLSVVEGTRNAHLLFLKPNEVENTRKKFSKYGLDIVLLNKEGADDGKYGNHSLEYTGGDNFIWRSILTRPENIPIWKDIWATREKDILLGEYLIGINLGYPGCCASFFTKVWMNDGYIDTTWQQAVNTLYPGNLDTDKNTIVLPDTTKIWASNLLRWAGLKIVPHLPCSFDCEDSRNIAFANTAVAMKYGYGYEYSKLYQMLDWDITWTAEYGIATIETPVFTITTVTDITTEKYVVHKKGHNNCIL